MIRRIHVYMTLRECFLVVKCCDCGGLQVYLLRMSKLSSVLFRNFSYWRLPLCWVMLETYKENYQKCNLSSHIVFVYDCAVLQQLLILCIPLWSWSRVHRRLSYASGNSRTSFLYHRLSVGLVQLVPIKPDSNSSRHKLHLRCRHSQLWHATKVVKSVHCLHQGCRQCFSAHH